MSVCFETHGHEDKFWNLGPMPDSMVTTVMEVASGFLMRAAVIHEGDGDADGNGPAGLVGGWGLQSRVAPGP